MKKTGKILLFIVEILLLLLFIGGLFVYGQIDSRLNKIETPVLDETKLEVNQTAPKIQGYKTYALFGIDYRSKNATLGTDNSDTMIIASVNNDKGDVKLVSVYRDTLLDIGSDTYAKANAAYAYGGPEQAISMLNKNLDLNITDYVTVDFSALVKVIEDLGGLDLPLSYAEMVHMNNYCIETSEETGVSYTPLELPERPEDIEATLGTYHLGGVQAVSYCRIRYTGTMDMGRTERQRRVIELLTDKARKAGITTIFKIMDDVFPMVKTSVSKTEILNLIPTMISYRISETTGFPGSFKFADIQSASVIVSDTLENNVVELHKFLYGNQQYTPSANIVESSAKIIGMVGGEDSLMDTNPLDDQDDTVTTGDVVWQGDGSGNYDYANDGDSNDYDYSYDNSGYDNSDYDNSSYDNSEDFNSGYDYSDGDTGDYDGEGSY